MTSGADSEYTSGFEKSRATLRRATTFLAYALTIRKQANMSLKSSESGFSADPERHFHVSWIKDWNFYIEGAEIACYRSSIGALKSFSEGSCAIYDASHQNSKGLSFSFSIACSAALNSESRPCSKQLVTRLFSTKFRANKLSSSA